MPAPIKGVARGGVAASKPGAAVSYVKFSDKLTASITDISKIIEQHKEMIDFFHWLTAHSHGQICPHRQPDSGCAFADLEEPAAHPQECDADAG